MGSGKGNPKGGGGKGGRKKLQQPPLPMISSRDELNRAIRDATAKAAESDKRGHLIVLKFTANWCSACKKIAPFFEELPTDPKILEASTSLVVSLYNVDVDESPDLVNFYGASSLPLFVFLVDGKKVDTLVGAKQTVLKFKVLKHACLSNK